MSAPDARVVADSVSPTGRRLTTLEVTLHRFVLAELNTHRVMSRNSASSRAIPLQRQLDRVRDAPAVPVVWASEQRGMQGGDELDDETRRLAETLWLEARDEAAHRAHALGAIGVHKSICNRLLEPFMRHTVVLTATAWENLWRQRLSPLAQPEFRVAAEAMRAAYDASTPVALEDGQWHLPYLDADTIVEVTSSEPDGLAVLRRVSAARCARVSYLTQDGQRDYHADLELYARLVSADPMHASPLEHVATPAPWNEHDVEVEVVSEYGHVLGKKVLTLPRVGNLLGWFQLRHEVEVRRDRQSFS